MTSFWLAAAGARCRDLGAGSEPEATLPHSCPIAGVAAPERLTRLRLGCKDEFGGHWGRSDLGVKIGSLRK